MVPIAPWRSDTRDRLRALADKNARPIYDPAIIGSLRSLEYYEFRLVREALLERETLWRIAPHVIWPLRLGLFLHDHLGARALLPATRTLRLDKDPAGEPLTLEYKIGFEYSDCWVEDSRLVVLNARDAADRGAVIAPRTHCVDAKRDEGVWRLASLQARTAPFPRPDRTHRRLYDVREPSLEKSR